MKGKEIVRRGSFVERITAYKTSDGELHESHASAAKYQRVLDMDEAIGAWFMRNCVTDEDLVVPFISAWSLKKAMRNNGEELIKILEMNID